MQRQRQPRNAWSRQKTEEAWKGPPRESQRESPEGVPRGSTVLLTRNVCLLASRTESKFLLSPSTLLLHPWLTNTHYLPN